MVPLSRSSTPLVLARCSDDVSFLLLFNARRMLCQEAGGFEDMESAGRSTVQEARKMELNENILDVPLPWASRLDISKDLFRLKYPPRGASDAFGRDASV